MSTPSGPPRSLLFYCAIIAIVTVLILGLLESHSLSASTTPAPSSDPLHLIHTHGSAAPDAGSTRRETAPTVVATVSSDKRPQTAVESPRAFDGGSEDPLDRRSTVFDAWRRNSDDWAAMDSSLKACTRMKFVNGFYGKEPEDAIDACLAQAEREEAERAEREANGAVTQEDFE